MPFTVSHAAAALPLHRWLGRYAVMSALVIGCWTPDLPYFIPLAIPHSDAHSALGLVYYCIPTGLACYAIFHRLLKQPLLALMPRWIAVRLGRFVDNTRHFPAVPWYAILCSLLAGAASHLAWDACTHATGVVVNALAVLRQPVLRLGGHVLFGYSALQHASTLVGLLVMWRGAASWLAQAREGPLPILWSARRRAIGLASICVLAVGSMCVLTLLALPTHPARLGVRIITVRLVIAAVQSSGMAIVLYSCGWQLCRWLAKSSSKVAGGS